jgi:hypothetical protein
MGHAVRPNYKYGEMSAENEHKSLTFPISTYGFNIQPFQWFAFYTAILLS